MVSLLSGVELLRGFGFYAVVFPFILVTAIVYGILSKLKPLGDNMNINIIISAVIGFVFISFLPAVTFIHLLIPYLVILFVIVLFIILIFMFMGVDLSTLKEAYENPGVFGVLIGVVVLGVIVFLTLSLPPMGPVSLQPGQPAPGSAVELVAPGHTEEGVESKLITPAQSEAKREEESKLAGGEKTWLEQTLFHPTIISLVVMLVIFIAATYVITAVKM